MPEALGTSTGGARSAQGGETPFNETLSFGQPETRCDSSHLLVNCSLQAPAAQIRTTPCFLAADHSQAAGGVREECKQKQARTQVSLGDSASDICSWLTSRAEQRVLQGARKCALNSS